MVVEHVFDVVAKADTNSEWVEGFAGNRKHPSNVALAVRRARAVPAMLKLKRKTELAKRSKAEACCNERTLP